MTKLPVQVTAEDITRGAPCSTMFCPVALALRRITGEGWNVLPAAVWRSGATVNNPYVALPAKARRWIARLDDGERVKPFAFTLPIP